MTPHLLHMTTQKKVLVIDYGMGNLKSVANALLFLGFNATVSNKKEDIINADAYVLPGVGAFGEAMKNLSQLNLIDLLNEEVLLKKKPLLGICLGMQLIADSSEEFGDHQGLGWIPGRVIKLNVDREFRLPHVGWNQIHIQKSHPLFLNLVPNPVYYFVHTYHLDCEERYISAKCSYGKNFVASVQKENIMAVQFHPEKSQDNGLRLLRNYLNFIEEYYAGDMNA